MAEATTANLAPKAQQRKGVVTLVKNIERLAWTLTKSTEPITPYHGEKGDTLALGPDGRVTVFAGGDGYVSAGRVRLKRRFQGVRQKRIADCHCSL